MKNILLVILIIGVFVSAYCLLLANNFERTHRSRDPELASELSETVKISNVSFSYRTSPDGYVLINDQISWPENIISSISLFSKRDYEWFAKPEFQGEGPPSITMSVFKNPERLNPQAWAKANFLVSNIELIDTVPVPVEVGGVKGVYYTVLGLYFFDTYVFAYDDEVYLFSGAYHEKNDEYYQNFTDLMMTIVFE